MWSSVICHKCRRLIHRLLLLQPVTVIGRDNTWSRSNYDTRCNYNTWSRFNYNIWPWYIITGFSYHVDCWMYMYMEFAVSKITSPGDPVATSVKFSFLLKAYRFVKLILIRGHFPRHSRFHCQCSNLVTSRPSWHRGRFPVNVVFCECCMSHCHCCCVGSCWSTNRVWWFYNSLSNKIRYNLQ
jgi:hypothetical protein